MRANGIAIRCHFWLSVRFTIALLVATLAAAAAQAAITASGNTSANPTSSGANPVIGIFDIGRLSITAGSSVTSNTAVLGQLVAGIGLVTVTDFNSGTGATSTWTTTRITVGDIGTGRLEILNGGIVTVDFASNPGAGDFVVGNQAGSVGTVIVNGLGSLLRLGDDTVIGQNGTGVLRIENEGYVVGTNGELLDPDIFTVGSYGRVEFSNGRLRTDQFVNYGAIVGTGRLDSPNTIVNTLIGHIDATAGQRLVVNGVVDNDGAIAIHGGEIEFFKGVTNSGAGAEITLRDQGVVRFQLPQAGFGFDSTAGVLATTAGTNDIYGSVRIQTSASKISVSGGSTAVFHDPVTNTGGTIEVFAGSTIVYLQGLTTTGSGASLSVALSDPDVGAGAGAIEVSDGASLAGNLNVSLAAGYKPSAGDVFPIITAGGGITGALNLASAPALPGGMLWDLDVTATNVLLSVVATGDYNGNGVVDAADYVVWRKSLNQQGSGLAADSNGDGIVNTADYNFWRSRVGNVIVSTSGLGTSTAIPEPTSAALLLFAGAIAGIARKRF